MAILVGDDTRLLVQGLTGREGSFHGKRNRDYGTSLVAGVTPGKGGTDVGGVPVFNTVAEAVDSTGANTAMVFVPPRFAADAILESYDAGIEVIIAITEGIPAMDMARTVGYLRAGGRRARLVGPNCPGVISPGKANVGIIPGEICEPGPVGLVSRSGTLTYQIVHELTQRDIGQSTCVGIGGDPIPGSDFIDVLEQFEADEATKLVVLVGEIGGDAEERAAAWVKENMSVPVVAYIAGFTAPPGKRMGHAGAIISGSRGTAQAKAEALEAAGIRVGRDPSEVAELVASALS
jgi:succinyl-CoA synthetase alpha subunit